ncbi:immunity protein Imm33 domain-containing protein [Paenibacillus sp. FA6]|uniref:immunity protein Imm33 domain-containing protein n=1 Tax=Paenibacillus sp. FA6 TaxID=3413029 RepID=UPI003F656C73
MKINNSEYGGFLVSKNIISGCPIRYSFREKSSIPQLNEWNLYSVIDDDYINNAENFTILSAESIFGISPIISEFFDAPYGTDICWLYEEGVHTGFYDLISENEVTLGEILRNT